MSAAWAPVSRQLTPDLTRQCKENLQASSAELIYSEPLWLPPLPHQLHWCNWLCILAVAPQWETLTHPSMPCHLPSASRTWLLLLMSFCGKVPSGEPCKPHMLDPTISATQGTTTSMAAPGNASKNCKGSSLLWDTKLTGCIRMATKIVNEAEVKCSAFIQCVSGDLYAFHHMCNMSHPSHLPGFDQPHIWQVQTRSSSLCSFLQPPLTPTVLDPNVFLRFLFSYTLKTIFFTEGETHKVSHPNKTTDFDPSDKWQQEWQEFYLFLISSVM